MDDELGTVVGHCYIVRKVDDNGEVQTVHHNIVSAHNHIGNLVIEYAECFDDDQISEMAAKFHDGKIDEVITDFNSADVIISIERQNIVSDYPAPDFIGV